MHFSTAFPKKWRRSLHRGTVPPGHTEWDRQCAVALIVHRESAVQGFRRMVALSGKNGLSAITRKSDSLFSMVTRNV